ncbi:HD domain-containing protein [Desulfovibrio inopinatus]|uniref:HD domain-containing protein n=1 Tax=Desulfovibrio inopinatus TaxID=102109 RepID=UPI0003F77A23|nr:HD domain-containing protein [Desulfovibrio inopinatus]
MKIYLVGGAVRDLLLGRQAHDRDFVVEGATPEEFQAAFPKAIPVGKAFEVFLIDHEEYALLRDSDIHADLMARDLTINAMALDTAETGACCIIAHPNAIADLADLILRPASDTAFSTDPVRVFRAARFFAEFPTATPHISLHQLMHAAAQAHLLSTVASERVCAETRKALVTARPDRFFQLLADTACLSPWFAELVRSDTIPAGPPQYHDGSVFQHTLEVMRRLAGNPLQVWMGLCHDLGKTITPSACWPHHYRHDHYGIDLAQNLGKRLGMPNKYIQAGMTAAADHMRVGKYDTLRPGTRVDLLDRLHRKNCVDDMIALAKADHGHDVAGAMKRDLAVMLSIRLPEEARNKGLESGNRLRELRCEAVAQSMKTII